MANLYYKIEDLFLQETSILYDRLFLPASFKITDHKAERTEYPVNDHRNPDTKYTHALDIRTTADTTDRLLLVKDSYANSVIPFLTAYYREIIVVQAVLLLPHLLP